MKVDSKFNKRAAKLVPCNYTQVMTRFNVDPSEVIVLRFFGGGANGDLVARMNVLEAHRLVGQLNDALAAHAKSSIAKAAPWCP